MISETLVVGLALLLAPTGERYILVGFYNCDGTDCASMGLDHIEPTKASGIVRSTDLMQTIDFSTAVASKRNVKPDQCDEHDEISPCTID